MQGYKDVTAKFVLNVDRNEFGAITVFVSSIDSKIGDIDIPIRYNETKYIIYPEGFAVEYEGNSIIVWKKEEDLDEKMKMWHKYIIDLKVDLEITKQEYKKTIKESKREINVMEKELDGLLKEKHDKETKK